MGEAEGIDTCHIISSILKEKTIVSTLLHDVQFFQELKRELTRMFTSENLYPIFFEVYKRRRRFSHMQLECIPLPKEIGESAPIYFKVRMSSFYNMNLLTLILPNL